jgi:hypothetical protein
VVADDLREIIIQAGRGVNDVTPYRQFEGRGRLNNGERLKISDEGFSGHQSEHGHL